MRKIHVDLDPSELGKNVPVDVAIADDVRSFLAAITPQLRPAERDSWLARIES